MSDASSTFALDEWVVERLSSSSSLTELDAAVGFSCDVVGDDDDFGFTGFGGDGVATAARSSSTSRRTLSIACKTKARLWCRT
jgi:hypothetical protein